MEKLSGFLIAAALFFSMTSAEAQTVAVSPGNETADAVIEQTCPTFSWSSVEGASTYSVAVFEMKTDHVFSHDEMQSMGEPVLSIDIGAPSLSWTPSGGCLSRGMKYVWYVKGAGKDGEGQWSDPKGFQVEASALSLEQKDAVQEAVKAYLNGEGAQTAASAMSHNAAQVTMVGSFDTPPENREPKKKSVASRGPLVASGSDTASVVMPGNMDISGYDIQLHSDDKNGLGWYNGLKAFTSTYSTDGPVLYGYDGGALGTTYPNVVALSWNWAGNVTVANNLKASSLTYASAQTRHFTVSGAAFIPYISGTTWNRINSSLTSTTGIFTAPLLLPDSAVITKMTVHYYDNSATNFGVTLIRLSMDNNYSIMAAVSTTGANTTWQTGSTTTISNGTVDNNLYAYDIYVSNMDGSTNHSLGGVTIEYTVMTPLP